MPTSFSVTVDPERRHDMYYYVYVTALILITIIIIVAKNSC
jgi:hypothetical protein